MGLAMQRMLVLAKVETTYGTDAAPTPALNSILASGSMPELVNADFVPRNLIRPFKGNNGSLVAGVHRRMKLSWELAGSGAAGTAPKWAPLIRACFFQETINAGVSAVYQPFSTGVTGATIYCYLDGLLFKLLAAIGSPKFTLNAKGIPVVEADFLGEYSTPSDVALPTGADYTGWTTPVVVGKINTPTFSFQGVSVTASDFGIDFANQLVYRDLMGNSGPWSGDRTPKGNCKFELTTVATKNWAEQIRTNQEAALSLVHGTTAGNIIQIDCPKVRITSASIENQDEVAMLNVGFDVNPNAGNDELVLTVK